MTSNIENIKAYIETMELTVKSGDITMNSRELAAITEKRHDHVLRDIDDEISKIKSIDDTLLRNNKDVPNFGEIFENDSYGRPQRMYILTKNGILQLLGRYSAFVRGSIIKRLEVLDEIARFGGREIESYKDLESLYKVMKPIVYFIYEAYDNFSRNDFVDEEVKEYYEEERRKWSKRVHSEEAFTEWWNNLNKHQKDTGIYDRVIMRPSKEEMNK